MRLPVLGVGPYAHWTVCDALTTLLAHALGRGRMRRCLQKLGKHGSKLRFAQFYKGLRRQEGAYYERLTFGFHMSTQIIQTTNMWVFV